MSSTTPKVDPAAGRDCSLAGPLPRRPGAIRAHIEGVKAQTKLSFSRRYG